jgi:membrane dipeptidase
MASAKNAAKHAAELHKKAIVIDCHCDILMPIAKGYVRLGKQVEIPDPRKWVPPFEMMEGTTGWEKWPVGRLFGTIGQYSLPQFLAGGLTAQVCAVFVDDGELDHALRKALEMVYWFHREAEENEKFEVVTSAEDIRRCKREGKCGGILALEGFEPMGYDLKMLDIFYKLGVRMGGLAHNRRSYFSDGTQHNIKTAGLTETGKQAVKRMNELGIVVDVGHLTMTGFRETLEISTKPVVLSHRSPRKFFPLKPEDSLLHPSYDVSGGREGLEALARNGGVFGVFSIFARDVEDVVDDMVYLIDLVGPDDVGLGSDVYGLKAAPKGLEDISKTPAITECLVRRGYSDEVILKVLGGNFMRVFEAVWKD